MTKATILRCLEEIASKLVELRAAVEKLPEAIEEMPAGPLASQGSKDTTSDQLQAVQFVDKQQLQPLVAKAFAEMGIQGEPVGAEKVQEMIAACGVKPEDNVFSRGIIEMREE